jgi:hypothetical protein
MACLLVGVECELSGIIDDPTTVESRRFSCGRKERNVMTSGEDKGLIYVIWSLMICPLSSIGGVSARGRTGLSSNFGPSSPS